MILVPVLLEAAASGLPIVTTRYFNGVAELLTEGIDALLVLNPADAEELAEQMRVMCNESVRKEMGCAARRMARQHTFDRNVEEMLAVYQECVPGLPQCGLAAKIIVLWSS